MAEPTDPKTLAELKAKADALCGTHDLLKAAMADEDTYNAAGQALQELIIHLLNGQVSRSPLTGHVLLHMGFHAIKDTSNVDLNHAVKLAGDCAVQIWGEQALKDACAQSLEQLKKLAAKAQAESSDPFDLPDLPYFDLKTMGSKKPTLH